MNLKRTLLPVVVVATVICLIVITITQRPFEELASTGTTTVPSVVTEQVAVDQASDNDASASGTETQQRQPQFIAYYLEKNASEPESVQRLASKLAEEKGYSFRAVPIPEIDSPRRPEIVQITTELDALGITGIPAVALIDDTGKVVKVVENWPGEQAGVQQCLNDMLTSLEARDAAFAEAEQCQGLERAKALHRGLKAVGPVWSRAYLDEAQEIIALDPENETGLCDHYIPTLVEIQIDRFVQDQVYPMIDLGRFDEAAKSVASLRTALPVSTDQSQMLLGFEGQLYANAGDMPKAADTIKQCIAVNPESQTAVKMRHYLTTLQ